MKHCNITTGRASKLIKSGSNIHFYKTSALRIHTQNARRLHKVQASQAGGDTTEAGIQLRRRAVLSGGAVALGLIGPLGTPLGLGGNGLGLASSEAVWDGQGRQPHVLITGSNTGIGKAGAEELARRGWAVTLACRSEGKAAAAAEDIRNTLRAEGRNPVVGVGVVDLASLDSVRAYASSVGSEVDVLWNNAGVMAVSPQQYTRDGFELQFGVNHLGHFLLTCLLEDQLKAGSVCGSEGGRVVSTSSEAHLFATEGLKLDDLNCQNREYKRWGAYGESKLANILMMRELDRRCRGLRGQAGRGVTAYSFHPGVVDTELGRYIIPEKWMADMKANPDRSKFVMNKLFGFKTPVEGADTGVYLATDKDVEALSSEFFDQRKLGKVSSFAKDMDVAAKLWEKSIELTGAPPNAWSA
eukprot:CAMPEP_0196592636 /NCGR_PEP_ID=MMETSP1081-20130531/73316_1 /TAXON_ID=36882 /ORGANISM="Pyramimonas amylifera, Strain CCMP720" /LENGTH=412 /DNA_ID=CAMNT_0041916383 /DNA_START=118 /DNA_END=1356 /DNA_ORIENTATION=-